MAIDFPDSPVLDDTYTVSGRTWLYDGEKWTLISSQEDGVPVGGLEGQILAKETDANYDLEWIDNYTGDLRIIVKNDSGVTISKGQAVMAVGAVGDRIQVAKAVADGSVSAKYMLGIASQDISNGTDGYIQMLGEVRNLNTIAYSVGTVLYIDPNTPGNLTSTAPVAPDLAEAVAIVTRSHASTGILFVRMWSQGESVSDLHDVAISNTLASGDFLKYDGTKWVNDQINLGTDTVGNYMSNVSAGTGISISHTESEGSTATITNSGVTGITGTANQISASSSTGSVTLSLPTNITVSGNVTANTNLVSNFSSGDEGGEIKLAKPQTNTSLAGQVTIDIYQNKLRFFENGGSARGFYLDIASGSGGAGTSLSGTITVQAIREKTVDGIISSNTLTCSHLDAGVFYVTSPIANFTVNVTNLPTDDGFTATVSIFVQQDATGRIPNALQIAGTGQTIKWSGGSAPTPTSSSGKIDVFTFTMIRRGSSWTVLGSANLNY